MNDKTSIHRFFDELLEAFTNPHIVVYLLCSNIVDDENFVYLMNSLLTGKGEKLSSFLSKTGNRVNLKKLTDRIHVIIDRCPSVKLSEALIILIAVFCSNFTVRLSSEESLRWIIFLTNQTRPSEDLLKTTLCTILVSSQLLT